MQLKPLVMLGLVLAAVFAVGAASRTQHNRILVSKNGSGSGTVTSDAPGDNATPINCGATCSGLFKAVTVTLTAVADRGSTFDGWGGVCSGTGTCSIYVSATPESGFTYGVSATFNTTKYPLTVAIAGSGKGTVVSMPAGIGCPGTCVNGYSAGTSVLLTATADSASTFAGWDGACSGTQPTCTVAVDQAKSVTATFTAKIFSVLVARTGSGSGSVRSTPAGIACGGTCSADLAGSVHLIATPAAGSSFIGWGGACSGAGSCALTLDAPKSVTARFDDTRAPRVKALAGSGRRGKTVRLRYSVRDESGRAAERVTVLRGRRALAALSHPRTRLRGIDSVVWRVPSRLKPGVLRFCLVATDPAGNRSARSCAALRIS